VPQVPQWHDATGNSPDLYSGPAGLHHLSFVQTLEIGSQDLHLANEMTKPKKIKKSVYIWVRDMKCARQNTKIAQMLTSKKCAMRRARMREPAGANQRAPVLRSSWQRRRMHALV